MVVVIQVNNKDKIVSSAKQRNIGFPERNTPVMFGGNAPTGTHSLSFFDYRMYSRSNSSFDYSSQDIFSAVLYERCRGGKNVRIWSVH